MSKIFQVLSNLNHSGDLYKAGTFFEGELSEFGNLVKDGVLRVVEEAKTIAEAQEIVAKEDAAKANQTASEESAPNTWGPKAEAPEAPAEPEKPAAPADQVGEKADAETVKPGEVGTGDVAPVNAGDNL